MKSIYLFNQRPHYLGYETDSSGYFTRGIIIEDYITGDTAESVIYDIEDWIAIGNSQEKQRVTTLGLRLINQAAIVEQNLHQTLVQENLYWHEAHSENIAIDFVYNGQSVTVHRIVTDPQININNLEINIRGYEGGLILQAGQGLSPGLDGFDCYPIIPGVP